MICIDWAIELIYGIFDGRDFVVVVHHFLNSLVDIIVDVELVIGDLFIVNFEDTGGSGFGADWAANATRINKEVATTTDL